MMTGDHEGQELILISRPVWIMKPSLMKEVTFTGLCDFPRMFRNKQLDDYSLKKVGSVRAVIVFIY
jgi:hypothetical protein